MATTVELLECLAKNEKDFARFESLLSNAAHLEAQDQELIDRIQVLIDRIGSSLRQRQQQETESTDGTTRAPTGNRDTRNKRKQELAAMRQRMQRVMDRLGL